MAQEESTAQHRVQRAFHAHTVAQVHSALAAFAADQRRVAQTLAAITPPPDAVSANEQLARAFDDNASAIDGLLTKLAVAKSAKQALNIIQRDRQAQQVGREIDSALAKLKKLGYTKGS